MSKQTPMDKDAAARIRSAAVTNSDGDIAQDELPSPSSDGQRQKQTQGTSLPASNFCPDPGPGINPTKENWRANHRNVRWSFQNMNQIFCHTPIARGGPVAELEAPKVPVPDAIGALQVQLADGTPSKAGTMSTVSDIIATTDTDGWMVLHGNEVVVEQYFGEMQEGTRHLLMSVSKSLTATIAGALVGKGLIDPGKLVTHYVPDLDDNLSGSGYVGATVRQLLDMRSGIKFSEAYRDPRAEVDQLDAAVEWSPPPFDGAPDTLKKFVRTLERAKDDDYPFQEREHGGRFEYRSCETTVLGLVCEAVADTGKRFADQASELLWSRLGAEQPAYITGDREGTGMFDGGFCTTLRDLARFGAMICRGGVSLTGEQVVPGSWVADIVTGDPDSAMAFAASPKKTWMPGGMYRNMFWFPTASRDVLLCIGIHGQLVYIDRTTGMVGVKLSSWMEEEPKHDNDVWKGFDAVQMFKEISAHLPARSGTASSSRMQRASR